MFRGYFDELFQNLYVSQRFSVILYRLITYEGYEKDLAIYALGDIDTGYWWCRLDFCCYCQWKDRLCASNRRIGKPEIEVCHPDYFRRWSNIGYLFVG